jgi:hypothetical protein
LLSSPSGLDGFLKVRASLREIAFEDINLSDFQIGICIAELHGSLEPPKDGT